MSGINQPKSIGTEDPEYYGELFCKTPTFADRHLPPSCPDVPSIQDVDGPSAQRIQTLLDSVADISLCQQGNISATMASLKDDNGTLDTRLYIVFNHQADEAARRCPQHLRLIFNMLRRVPYMPPAMDGSPKVIANELKGDFTEICRAIHNYSFDIFVHRVTKRKDKLSDIRRYIEEDRTHFTPQHRSTLVVFLGHVDAIITSVAKAQTTKQLSTLFIEMLQGMYSYWTKHGLLPKDPPDGKRLTLLDDADAWLAFEHGICFQLRRWALKIMSFLISANRLFIITQSHRLRKLMQGKFSVQALPSPLTAPYSCKLSSETVQVALHAALAETSYLSTHWDEKCKSFIERLLEELDVPEVHHSNPTVHAELAMIMAMAKGEIKDVLPYVGVSKLSCIMCSHYICAFNEVMEQKIATRGSHGKAYPGWSWPILPDLDRKLRTAFLGRMRQQVLSDFKYHAETRRPSDSSMGSGGPEWEADPTDDKIDELVNAVKDSMKEKKTAIWRGKKMAIGKGTKGKKRVIRLGSTTKPVVVG